MAIYDNKQWISDLDEVISAFPLISELEDKAVFITGATGLICSAVIDLLIRYNETHKKKIRILAAGRSQEKMTFRFGRYSGEDYFVYIPYDASKPDIQFDFACDYIIHGASNASPDQIVKEPVETMLCNFFGMNSLLDYAKKCDAKRVLFISSSEIYGKKQDQFPYREEEYAYIDLLNYRNSYSVSKRAAETLCASYASEYSVDSVIVRPGHIYGPTASSADKRVGSAWALAAARGEDIVMKSDGAQIRSYCYCLDCASAILTVLIKGKNCCAYNISNPDSIISIKQMAELLSEYGKVKIQKELPLDKEKKSFNPMSNSSLNSSALQLLGWHGLFDAKRGFEHSVEILRSMEREGIHE